jgi:hypothetical protein
MASIQGPSSVATYLFWLIPSYVPRPAFESTMIPGISPAL